MARDDNKPITRGDVARFLGSVGLLVGIVVVVCTILIFVIQFYACGFMPTGCR